MKPKDEKKRQAIRRAMLDLVEKNGLAGVKMSEVAKKARIATGTLYVYFKTKEELITTFYHELKLEAMQQLALVIDSSKSAEENLKILWFSLFDYHLESYKETVFIDLFKHSSYFNASLQQQSLQAMAPFMAFVDQAKAQEELKPLDNLLIMHIVYSMVRLGVDLVKQGQMEYSKELVESMWQVSWDAVKNKNVNISE